MKCNINKKIAVMMSSYNGEKYIEEQIKSILNQSVREQITLYIRDDGSTDGTIEILKKLENCNPKIKVEYGTNIGYNASFFKLFEKVYNEAEEYDYFSVSDQDDVWDEDKLEIAIDKIEKCGTEEPILYGSVSRLVDSQSRKVLGLTRTAQKPITLYNTLIQNFFPGHSQVMNRKLMERVVSSEADINQIYVYDSYILNIAIIFGRVVFDSIPHTDYRQHRNNQLGFSKGFFEWCKQRLQRVKKGDQAQYARQTKYIIEKFCKEMTDIQQEEVCLFIESNRSLFKRIFYVLKTKFYRQGTVENFLFKILYIFGKYKSES